MKVGIIGCGFWAKYQVAAWKEADRSLQFVFCDRDDKKAYALSKKYQPASVYTDAEEMMKQEDLDLVDIITGPETHNPLCKLAAKYAIPVMCQKPMAPDLSQAEEMLSVCRKAGVPLFIHENFRWQLPMRTLKQKIDKGIIGQSFRARIYFNCSFPVFENQPTLAEVKEFIIADLGVHLLDLARFLFGEVKGLFCHIQSVNPGILGEDVATLLMEMENGITCTVEMSYASQTDYECFPQTLVELEGSKGFIRLGKDLKLKILTEKEDSTELLLLPDYDWVHPEYAVAHASMVPLHEHFLDCLKKGVPAETSGEDNLNTLKLVYAAYASAKSGKAIDLQSWNHAKE